MDAKAEVYSLQSISEWRHSLKQFVAETQTILHSADSEIKSTLGWLQEHLHYCRHSVEECEEAVHQARRELECCRENYDSNCSAEEEELYRAKYNLRKAQEELEKARKHLNQVEQVNLAYQARALLLRKILSNDLSRADTFLVRIINDLQSYLAVQNQATLNPVDSSLPTQAYSGIQQADKAIPWKIVGDQEENRILHSALMQLENSGNGRHIAQEISSRKTLVLFGEVRIEGKTAIAAFYSSANPSDNKIVLDNTLKQKSYNVLAGHLAHEGTHLIWKSRWDRPHSKEEELDARKAQDAVWQELKGSEEDWDCDDNHLIVSGSDAEAKRELKDFWPYSSYPDQVYWNGNRWIKSDF